MDIVDLTEEPDLWEAFGADLFNDADFLEVDVPLAAIQTEPVDLEEIVDLTEEPDLWEAFGADLFNNADFLEVDVPLTAIKTEPVDSELVAVPLSSIKSEHAGQKRQMSIVESFSKVAVPLSSIKSEHAGLPENRKRKKVIAESQAPKLAKKRLSNEEMRAMEILREDALVGLASCFLNYMEHHADIKCQYNYLCDFNFRPTNNFNGLNQHYCSAHKLAYDKQIEPLEPLLLKFGSNDFYSLYEQCGFCPAMVCVSYGEHLKDKLRKAGWQLHRDPKWINCFMENSFRLLKPPAKKLTGNRMLLEHLFENGYNVISESFQSSENIPDSLKNSMVFGTFNADIDNRYVRYYVMISKKLKLVYVGSTNLKLYRRFYLHKFAKQCPQLVNADDVEICLFSYTTVSRSGVYGKDIELFEFFIMNKLSENSEYTVVNRRVNVGIV